MMREPLMCFSKKGSLWPKCAGVVSSAKPVKHAFATCQLVKARHGPSWELYDLLKIRPATSRQPANPASVNALATTMNAVAVPSSKT